MVEVTILSQASCAFCDHAKEILSRLAQDFPLSVHEISMESEEGRSLAIKNAVLFAPGIFIDGKLFSYGRLSERKLRKFLDERR